jgi:hypothetical protein
MTIPAGQIQNRQESLLSPMMPSCVVVCHNFTAEAVNSAGQSVGGKLRSHRAGCAEHESRGSRRPGRSRRPSSIRGTDRSAPRPDGDGRASDYRTRHRGKALCRELRVAPAFWWSTPLLCAIDRHSQRGNVTVPAGVSPPGRSRTYESMPPACRLPGRYESAGRDGGVGA